ncbi:hypothetical protein SLEP1_g60522, partial [Rubroshorea leprosula]
LSLSFHCHWHDAFIHYVGCISQLGTVDYHPLKKLGDDMAEQSTCRFLFRTEIFKS